MFRSLQLFSRLFVPCICAAFTNRFDLHVKIDSAMPDFFSSLALFERPASAAAVSPPVSVSSLCGFICFICDIGSAPTSRNYLVSCASELSQARVNLHIFR